MKQANSNPRPLFPIHLGTPAHTTINDLPADELSHLVREYTRWWHDIPRLDPHQTRAGTASGYDTRATLFSAWRHAPMPMGALSCIDYRTAAAHRRASTQRSYARAREHSFNPCRTYIKDLAKQSNTIQHQNMYGLDPFSAQNAANDDPAHPPSIFGALPYPGSASRVADPPLHTLVTFRFTSMNPSLLDCAVVGPTNEAYYRLASGVSGQGLAFTLLKTAAGRNIALVEWRGHPTVEAQSVGPKQHVGQWLRLSSDRRSRTMVHGGIYYSWAPLDRFLHLFAPGSSEWLVRVTKIYDTVVLELTPRAIELGLIDVAVLATALLQSGKNID